MFNYNGTTWTKVMQITPSNSVSFPTLTSNGFLKTNSSNGSLIVDTTSYLPSSTSFEVPLTFTSSNGLTRSGNSISVNTSQNINKLTNFTSNGFVKTSASDGTLTIDSNTYLPSNTSYEVPLTFTSTNGLTRSANSISVNQTQNINRLSNLTSNGFIKTSSANGSLTIDTNTYYKNGDSATLLDITATNLNPNTVLISDTNDKIVSSGVSSTNLSTLNNMLTNATNSSSLNVGNLRFSGNDISAVNPSALDIGIQAGTGGRIYINSPINNINILGSQKFNYKVITSAYTITTDDNYIICNSGFGNFGVSLPSSSTVDGKIFTIKNGNNNNVQIIANGYDKIDGSNIRNLYSNHSITLLANSFAGWSIIHAFI